MDPAERRRYVRHVCTLPRAPAATRVTALLDVENLLHPVRSAGRTAVEAGLHAVVDHLRPLGDRLAVSGCGDHRIVADAYGAARRAGVRLFPGLPGPDRADGELLLRFLDVATQDDLAGPGVVVIGSGDRAFATTARRLREQGLTVVVLARADRLSRALARQADDVVDLRLPLPVERAVSLVCDCRDRAA